MIEILTGDLFKARAAAYVNLVNCVGVMGAGVALKFKQMFPENFREYFRAFNSGSLQPGNLIVSETGLMHPRLIINLPTKRHYRDASRLEDIRAGLQALRQEIHTRGLESVAIPALGAGLGGLPWHDVRQEIETALADLEGVQVLVYEPHEKKPPHVCRGRGSFTKN